MSRPSDLYRLVYDWGREHGWHVSTGQARELLKTLDVHYGVEEITVSKVIFDHEVPELADAVRRGLRAEAWHLALHTNAVPVGLPVITTQATQLKGAPATEYTATLQVRI